MDIISYSKATKALKSAGNVGNKGTILTNIKDKEIVRYDKDLGKFVNVKNKAIVEQWQANTKYDEGELFLFDRMLWVCEHEHTSNSGSDPSLDEMNGLCYPIATDVGFANVGNLTYTILSNGEQIKLDWINPIAATYEGRDVYYSTEEDITALRHNEIEDLITEGKNITKLTTGIGTDAGNADTVTITNAELRKYYYIKVFVEHNDPESGTVYSTGRYFSAPNPDIYPPAPPTNLTLSYSDEKIKLSWSQPTSDDDFLYTKIIRSTTSIPTLPTDGIVIDTVSGTGYYEDTTTLPNVTYYYRLFAYDDAGQDGMQHGQEGNYSTTVTASGEIRWVAIMGFDIATGLRTEYATDLVQSDFDNIYPYSNISRCVVDNEGNIEYYLDDEDSTLQEDGITAANLDGTDGNVVVEIPEFYYSKEGTEVKISEESFTNAIKFNRRFIGFSESSEGTNGKLQSIVGRQPLKMKSITEFRNMADAGWQLVDYETRDILKILFMIEYGGFNSQTLIGDGIVNETETQDTGDTITLGNSSGVSSNGSVSYRGIENLWGNIDEIVEGLIVTDTSYYTAKSNYNSFISDNNKGSYNSTGVTPITSDGYISLLNIEGNIVGSAVLGNDTDFVGDHQYSHKQGEINMVVEGGNYQDGSKAGLFRSHMGLSPFDKEETMVKLQDYDKVLSGSNIELKDEFYFTHGDNITLEIDGDEVEGNYYICQLPLLTDNDDFVSLDKIEIIEE